MDYNVSFLGGYVVKVGGEVERPGFCKDLPGHFKFLTLHPIT